MSSSGRRTAPECSLNYGKQKIEGTDRILSFYTMKCLGRRSNPNFVYFPNTTHRIYPEVRCGKETTGELCAICSARSEKAKPRLQSQPAYPHGIIGQPIPAWSHIYGGPWYESMAKQHGPLKEEDRKALEEAQAMARTAAAEKGSARVARVAQDATAKPKKKILRKKQVSPAQTLTLPAVSVVPSAPVPTVPPEWFETTDDVIPMESFDIVPIRKQGEEWVTEDGETFTDAACVQMV